MTDAISFNVLCRDQLEFIRDNSDFDITLICGGSQTQLDILERREVGKVINANFKRNPSVLKDTKSLLFLLKYLTLNRFDIVVYSTPKALLLGSIASCLTLHTERVAIVRGRVYENFSGKKRLFFHMLDKIALSASSKAIFISDSLRQAYLNEGLVKENKAVVLGSGSSNGVDIVSYSSAKASLTERQKDDSATFNVLTIGRICHDKGLYDLAKIIDECKEPRIKFLLVGQIEDKKSEIFLEDLLATHPNVEHIPHVEDVIKYFQEADLHLFLSHREGFGNVAIEAASCHVPTFAYNVVGIKDSVKNGVSGQRFEFKDTKAIAKSIDSAANDKGFSNRYTNAREWVIQNFEQRKVWKNYLDFYLQQIQREK
ncbi:glycosyltransferase [uncultured Psychrobacter sp.]|uniref:glycosyltransferase n=1 Tax=uncultured Psychrobacter sp. TaxID=259303 RepID=UPI00260F360F|nr:glycosyltransferase [uncultured Psychrobacter sp.]